MKTAPWIIIILLLGVIFLLRECAPVPDPCDCPEVDTVTVVQVDSVAYPVTSYVPKIVYKTQYINLNLPVDSAAVVAAFMELNYYNDTLVNDSNAFVRVEDTVGFNRIIWRQKTVRIFPRTIYTTQIVSKLADPQRKLFVGLGVGRSPESFGLAPSVLYISKRETAYSLHYDVLNKDFYFTAYFKIKLR